MIGPLFVRKSAALSPCGTYRWWLRREWKGGNSEVICFIMLNPSTADADTDDPTIRRCMSFAQQWGFSTLSVRNLFAYRATHPKDLLRVSEPIGGMRANHEILAGLTAQTTVVAWGAYEPLERDVEVLSLIKSNFPKKLLMCLGITKNGRPRHPLYVKNIQPLIPYCWKKKVVL